MFQKSSDIRFGKLSRHRPIDHGRKAGPYKASKGKEAFETWIFTLPRKNYDRTSYHAKDG